MKKKALLLASMGVLACTAGVIALVFGGANQVDAFPVKADPTEYSVTFNESNTIVEAVDDHYAIGTTTAAGNKVGVVGWDNSAARITFNGASFGDLMLHHYEAFAEVGAYPFSTITGFAISFSIEYAGEPEPFSVMFTSMDTMIGPVESGHEYKGLSITPEGDPVFEAMVEEGDNIIISSLTIWYSC